MADEASRKTSEESHARMRYTATRHGYSELPRTQKRYDLLQAQGAARQTGQYDLDEVEYLLTDGMRNIAGAERTADILSYSRDGKLANAPVVLGRAARGYMIPAGVYDVAATQQLLGVKADGMWGEGTENAYRALFGEVQQEKPLQSQFVGEPQQNQQAQNIPKSSSQKNVILQREDKGAAVENVQRWLEQLGFLDMSVSMDEKGNKQYGFYGGATRAAVFLYQFNYGFNMTGELDGPQYLDIYSRYLHGMEGMQENKRVLAYGKMVNMVTKMDREKGNSYKLYPMYQHLRKWRPVLPSPMKEADIRVVYKDGQYYMDYTEPLLKMLQKNIGEAEQARKSKGDPGLFEERLEALRIKEDMLWFYNRVKRKAIWDIKYEKNWNHQFPGQEDGVKFYHQAYPFVFLGNVVTAEDMGNILYGATGTAMGFDEEMLKWAGATPNIAVDLTNLFRSYFDDNQRDLDEIEYGIRLYNAFKARGSA